MSNSDEIVLAATMTSGPVSGGVAVVSTPEDLAKLVCKFALDCYKNDEFQSKMRLSDLFLSPDKRPGVTVTLGEHENDPFRFSEPFLGLWADYAANSEMLAPDSIKQYFPGHDLEHLIALAKQHPNYRMEWTSKTDENGHTTNTVKVEPLSSEPAYEIENASDDDPDVRALPAADSNAPEEIDLDAQKETALALVEEKTIGIDDGDSETLRRSEHEQMMLHGKKHALRQPTPQELEELEQSESVGKIMKVLQRAQKTPMTDELVDELSAVSHDVKRVQGALADSLMGQLKSTYERAKQHIEDKKEKAKSAAAAAALQQTASAEPEAEASAIAHFEAHAKEDMRVQDMKKLMNDALPHIKKSAALDKLFPRVEELLNYVNELQEEVEHGRAFVEEIGQLVPQIKAAREENAAARREVKKVKKALRKQDLAARIKMAKLENILEQTRTAARIDLNKAQEENRHLKQGLMNHRRAVESAHRLVEPTVGLIRKHEKLEAQKEELASKFSDLEKKLPHVLEKVRTLTATKARTTGLNDEMAAFMNRFLEENKRDALYSRIAGGDEVIKQLFNRVEAKYFAPSHGGTQF